MERKFLAFDLGAESGRAMLGSLRGGKLELREIHRFPNTPVAAEDGSLRWNIRGLFGEMRLALMMAPAQLASIGVDTWGIDFALIGRDGGLIEDPYHYRDRRTEGVMDAVFARVSRERIYSVTGIQFLPINTLYQLYAATHMSPKSIERAEMLLMIPDLLNYWLSGNRCAEYTIATTTQMVDARAGAWATALMDELGLPSRLFLPMVSPGAEIGQLRREVSESHAGVPVIAPACHDTASAVAAIAMSESSAYLSSGTWSLMGAEVAGPVITEEARDFNFTNEGGVCGTIRLLKNTAGMWLIESCRRCWMKEGRDLPHDELFDAASREPGLESLIDPDHPSFMNPENMPRAIMEYCGATGQRVAQSPPAIVRTILDSLALKYAATLDSLEKITARRFTEIRIVGGGSRNRLLNQLTADATGRTVIAGPAEATALGNIAMQMIATGAVASREEARALIDRCFETEKFEPRPDRKGPIRDRANS